MKVSTKKPPIWPIVKLCFPTARWGKGAHAAIVTFGDTTYCADELSDSLMAHELVHQLQQKSTLGAIVWWIRYIVSNRFRFEQELQAHVEEYRAICNDTNDRNVRYWHLAHIATRLSGPLYGNMVGHCKAMKLIVAGL